MILLYLLMYFGLNVNFLPNSFQSNIGDDPKPVNNLMNEQTVENEEIVEDEGDFDDDDKERDKDFELNNEDYQQLKNDEIEDVEQTVTTITTAQVCKIFARLELISNTLRQHFCKDKFIDAWKYLQLMTTSIQVIFEWKTMKYCSLFCP